MKKNIKKIFLLFFVSSLVACGNSHTTSGETEAIKGTDITFKAAGYTEGSDFKILRGKEVTIQATVLPKNATNRIVTWSSDNNDIEVTDIGDNKAKIKGWDVGEANVTVKTADYSEVLKVVCVTEIMPKSISVPTEVVELRDNTRMEVAVKVMPEDTTNQGINVSVSPLVTKKENNTNGMTYILQDEFFYIKELEADIDDTYKVNVVSQRDPTVKASFTVKIIPYDVETVTFTHLDPVISLNDPTYRMTPKYEPEVTTYLKSTFTSSNPEICDIDLNTGKLMPKQVGQATIRVTSEMSDSVYGETTVTVTNEPTKYLFRGFTKEMMDVLPTSTIVNQDMEFDKVAFAEWKAAFAEDTWYSHALDGGWAKWIVGQDYMDDNDQPDDDRMNTLVYNKVMVPDTASIAQFVFRSHLHPNDTSLLRILMVEDDYTIHDMTNGWIEFDQTYDKFINFDMTSYRGKALTWVIEQDQGYDIFDKDPDHCCGAKHLMFRAMRFDVEGVTITEDPFYELKDIHAGE